MSEERPEIYTDEYDEVYFARGHWTKEAMIEASILHAKEVADYDESELEELRNDLNEDHVCHYYERDSPDDDDGFIVCNADHPDARPMTLISR